MWIGANSAWFNVYFHLVVLFFKLVPIMLKFYRWLTDRIVTHMAGSVSGIPSSNIMTARCWGMLTTKPLIARFMGPIWGRQDPGGPNAGPMNLASWGESGFLTRSRPIYMQQSLVQFSQILLAITHWLYALICPKGSRWELWSEDFNGCFMLVLPSCWRKTMTIVFWHNETYYFHENKFYPGNTA